MTKRISADTIQEGDLCSPSEFINAEEEIIKDAEGINK
jgi:hypothetical protein